MRTQDFARPYEELDTPSSGQANDAEHRENDLTLLFRLLVRQPPKDHDFPTCPICQKYGITEI